VIAALPAGPPDAERIAVFRALQLGDMLCSVPALTALRAAYPRAHITLIGLPWARAFVSRFAGLIDELLLFPGALGFPEQRESDIGLPAFYAEAKRRRFCLALQLHGSGGVANDLLFNLGARQHAGFVEPSERPRDGCFIAWPTTAREPERYVALMQALGVPVRDHRLWFPVRAADRWEAATLIEEHAIDARRMIVVHCGAQLPSRRWPPERFAAVADALCADGAEIVLTGTAHESGLAATVRAHMSRAAVDLAGRTSLGGLAALLERAALVVCNDTGISHVAAALGVRSVVIACGSDTQRWSPEDAARHTVLASHPPCRPCAYADCPHGHVCALDVRPRAVIDAARAQLRHARGRRPLREAPHVRH
jgi:ADP-heptose:LPS heptosyltransferase